MWSVVFRIYDGEVGVGSTPGAQRLLAGAWHTQGLVASTQRPQPCEEFTGRFSLLIEALCKNL